MELKLYNAFESSYTCVGHLEIIALICSNEFIVATTNALLTAEQLRIAPHNNFFLIYLNATNYLNLNFH